MEKELFWEKWKNLRQGKNIFFGAGKNRRRKFPAVLEASELLLLLTFLALPASSSSLSFIPEFLWYKSCADSPPGFSPGCMSNVTVNIGDRAVFNCQVKGYLCTLSVAFLLICVASDMRKRIRLLLQFLSRDIERQSFRCSGKQTF
jgi:hypothetical protein